MELNSNDIASFQEQGFLHLRGVIPAECCIATEEAIWRAVTWRREDPATWPQGSVHPAGWELPEVRGCFTDSLLEVVDQIVGVGLHDKAEPAWRSFGPIIIFPSASRDSYPVPCGHIDQHGPMHRTFVLGVIVYLHDVRHHGGATAFWPGEHTRLEDTALRLRKLPADCMRDRDYEHPVAYHEAIGDRGDVLLYQRNCVHAGTANFSDRPRLALQTMVHLNAAGEAHARNRLTPRTPAEWSYDRHFEPYHLFNYFGCRAKNMNEE